MAFGNISTFYLPTAANAGSSLWGTDVRKVLSSADAGTDATTICDFGTGGAANRTCDPYSTTTADLDQSLYGWAIQPTDMNSVVGALRFFPAGNHVLTARIASNNLVSSNLTMTLYVYRVGNAAGSRARTLLGSGASALTGLNNTAITLTATVALSEVILAADETIQYAVELNTSGSAVTGRTETFYTGTQGGVAVKVDTPGLKTLADTTGSATGVGSASGVAGKVLGTSGSSTGVGSASGSMGASAATTGSAAGVGSASGATSSLSGTTGAAAGVGSASGLASKVLGTTGTVTIGAGGGGTTTYIRPVFVFDD